MGGSSSVPEEAEEPEFFSVPLNRAPQFIINQKGSLCTVNEERFIFTKIQNAPILVTLNSSPSIIDCLKDETPALKLSKYAGSVSIHVLWDENKSILLNNVPKGSEVIFDAVVFPKTNFYQAILVWQGRKPEKASMMLSDQYLVTNEFETQVSSVNLKTEPGFIEFKIGNSSEIADLNKENYFVNGKKVVNTDFTQHKSLKDLQAHIYEAETICGVKSRSSTKYVCRCLWEGEKPNQTFFPTINLKENNVYEYDEARALFKKPTTIIYLLNNVDGVIKKDFNEICIEFPKLNMTLPCNLHFVLNGSKITKISNIELPCSVYVTMYQISHQRVYSWRVLHATCVTPQNIASNKLNEITTPEEENSIFVKNKLLTSD